MARKLKKADDHKVYYIALFLVGAVVGAAVLYFANYGWYQSYPAFYAMPMMRGMMNYQANPQGFGTVDCVSVTEQQLEDTGDKFMTSMMGQEFDERMDALMTNDTLRMMHIAMGRMYTGC